MTGTVSGIWEWQTGLDCSLHTLFVAILSVIFGVALLVLLSFSVYQLLRGRTTIESFDANKHRHAGYNNVFDLGRCANWREVMGGTFWQWVFPVNGPYHAGKGLWFVTRDTDILQRLSSEILRRNA